MGGYYLNRDIFVSDPGNTHLVQFSDFPVSGICFRLCTWFFSFRGAFVRINYFAFYSQFFEKLYRTVKLFSVKAVMGVVSVSVGSNETAEMEDSEVLGNSALRNFKMAGKGINAEGLVVP